MREIKFRAWLKKEKKMGFVSKLTFSKEKGLYHATIDDDEGNCIFYGFIEEVELLQFTGLKDVDGTEIYEGDLMKHKKDLYLVEWRYGIASFCFTLLREDIKCYPNFNKGTVKSIEIVGNKFENPELLK